MVTNAAIAADPAPATRVVAITAGIARLPAGADIGNPRADGSDLLFVQPDGTVIVVPGGAVTAFALFVGDTEIPHDTLVALFDLNGLDTGAGPTTDGGAHGRFDALGPQTVGQGANGRPDLLADTTGSPAVSPPGPALPDSGLPQSSPPSEPDLPPPGPVNNPASIGGVATGAVTEDNLPAIAESFAGANERDWGDNAFINWGGPSDEFLTEYERSPGAQSVVQTFDTADAGRLSLGFDLIKIDAWEDDEFLVFLDGVVAFRVQPAAWPASAGGAFQLGGLTGTYVVTAADSDSDLLGDPAAGDRVYHVELILDGAGDTLTLGFGTTLDEDFADEDFGVDNIRIASTELHADGQLTIADADPGQAGFRPQSVAGDNGYGSFVLDASGHWTYRADNTDARIQAIAAGQAVTDSFTAWSLDGSASQVVTVTIHGVNDAPQLAANDSAAFVENAGAVIVAADLTIADVDSPLLTGATVTVTGFMIGDSIGYTAVDGITASYNAVSGRLDFSGPASLATYQALLRSVTFGSSSDMPTPLDRIVHFSVTDGSDISAVVDVSVSVTPANDAPTAKLPAAQSVAEDQALVFSVANANLIRVSDPDLDRVTVTLSVANGTLTRANGETGVELTLSGPAAQVNAALIGLKYTPTADYSGSDQLTVVVTDDKGASSTSTIDLTVTAVADQPVISVEQLVTTPVPLGEPVEVSQPGRSFQNLPDVTDLPDGGYAVVWQGEDILLRRFAADGTPLGNEVPVNAVIADTQSNAQVTALADGRLVVSWQSYGQDGSAFGIFARVFNADGSPSGNEFQVNTSAQYNQQSPSVTALADGGYLFTWSSTDGVAYGIYTQRFDHDGQPVGGETLVASGTVSQTDPTVISLPGGGYAVVWTDGDSGMTATTTSFRVFDENGVAGPVIRVNGGDHPDIAVLADGGYAVVSEVYAMDGSGDGIAVRVYDADGTPRTQTLVVNTTTIGHQEQPTVIGLPDGGFLVAWDGGATAPQGIYLQRYDADGNRVGVELRLNPDGYAPQLAVLASGDVVVTWQGDHGIEAQTVQATNATGRENHPFELPLTISLTDANGTPSEVLDSLHISGLPEGFSLDFGARDAAGDWVIDRSTPQSAAWLDSIAAGDLLVVHPAHGYDGNVTVSVTATSLEPSNGSTASTTALVSVAIMPGADEARMSFVDTDPGIDIPPLTETSIVHVVGDLAAPDLIADYDFANGDRVDLSDLLDGVAPGNVADFIRFSDGVIAVDADGAGPGTFVDAVQFSHPPAAATLLFDNGFEVVVGNA